MAHQTGHDADAVVNSILSETKTSTTPTIDGLRARAEQLPPAARTALIDRARQKNIPLMASSSPDAPPPPGIIKRNRLAEPI